MATTVAHTSTRTTTVALEAGTHVPSTTGTSEQQTLLDRIQQLRNRLASMSSTDQAYAEGKRLLDAAETALVNLHLRQGGGPLPPGVRQLSDDEIRALGIDPTSLHDRTSGYHAEIYFDQENNRYIYVNAGSNDALDWLNNGTQLLGLGSPQYQQAMENARLLAQAARANGRAVLFTGQSLGGGLASAQAYETGLPAITFNAAGLNRNTLSPEAQARFDQDIANPDNALVQAYQVTGEPLSLLQDETAGFIGLFFPLANQVPPAAGRHRDLPGIAGTSIFNPSDLRYRHSLAGVATSTSTAIDQWLQGNSNSNPNRQPGWLWFARFTIDVLRN